MRDPSNKPHKPSKDPIVAVHEQMLTLSHHIRRVGIREVARRCKIDVMTVQRTASGKRWPRLDDTALMCRALGLRILLA